MFKQRNLWWHIAILSTLFVAACFHVDSSPPQTNVEAPSLQATAPSSPLPATRTSTRTMAPTATPPDTRNTDIRDTTMGNKNQKHRVEFWLPIIVVSAPNAKGVQPNLVDGAPPSETPTVTTSTGISLTEETPITLLATRLAETVTVDATSLISDTSVSETSGVSKTAEIAKTSVISNLLTILTINENGVYTLPVQLNGDSVITSNTVLSRTVLLTDTTALHPHEEEVSNEPSHDVVNEEQAAGTDAQPTDEQATNEQASADDLNAPPTQPQEDVPATEEAAEPAAPLPNRPQVEPIGDGVPRTVRLPILMYHYLSVPPADANIYRQDLSVTPALFAAHLDQIQAAGFTTISLYDLYAHLASGAPLPEKAVILTFDDGYRDAYENAFPLLRDRGMTATFFVVTDFIDEQRPEYITWDMAREMLAAGFSIESHGRNHASLKGKDADYLIWQALGSMETIQFELGVRPRFVAYPLGDYDQLTTEIFPSASYWAGLTTVQGATHHNNDLFRLPRVRVRGTTQPDELLRLIELDW